MKKKLISHIEYKPEYTDYYLYIFLVSCILNSVA